MRKLAREAGFRTRSQAHYTIRDGFMVDFSTTYFDSATAERGQRESGLYVVLSAKTVESDQVLWRICQMTDELDKHSVDTIFGIDVVQAVQFAVQTFPIESPDDVARVCQQVVGFAIAGFASFLDSVGNSLDGFYRYVLGLDPESLWYREVNFPIAYIQLGDYQAALEYLKLIRNNPGILAHSSKGRPLSEYLAEYCQAHLGESRPVSLSGG